MEKNLKCLADEDPLVKTLIEAEGAEIEVIAFGISYTGILKKIDIENGYIVVSDEEDTATLELERISSIRRLD